MPPRPNCWAVTRLSPNAHYTGHHGSCHGRRGGLSVDSPGPAGEARLAQGDHEEARRCAGEAPEQFAREALEWALRGEQTDTHGNAYATVAYVLARSGRLAEAGDAGVAALDCYDRKGNRVRAAQMTTWLADLGDE